MTRERFDTIYQKYLDNKCSDEELKDLYKYILEFGTPQILKDLPNKDEDIVRIPELNSKAIWANISQQNASKQSTIRRFYKYGVAAASVILVAIFSFYIYNIKLSKSTEWIVNNQDVISKEILKDGTVVYLKPGSKIAYISDFESERNVTLVGEAFFDVAHDNQRPFVVDLPNSVNLKVLGTRFNVKTNNDKSDIVLTEGKLRVKNDNEEAIIHPMDRIVVSNIEMQRTKVDTLNYNSWINNEVYFDNKKLIDVISELKKYYKNEKMILPPPHEDLIFQGYLPTNNYELCKEILKKTFSKESIITN